MHWRTAQDQLSQHCRRSHYFTIVFGPLEIAIYGILPFRHGQIAGISVSLPCWLSRLIPFGTSGADHAKHCSWSNTFNVFGQLFCSDDLVVSGLQVKDRNTVKGLNLYPINPDHHKWEWSTRKRGTTCHWGFRKIPRTNRASIVRCHAAAKTLMETVTGAT